MNRKLHLFKVLGDRDRVRAWALDSRNHATLVEDEEGLNLVVWDWVNPQDPQDYWTTLHLWAEEALAGLIQAGEFPQ